MTHHDIEPNELAAFLDGRLSHRDRAEVIKRLVRSPESYDLFIETVEDLYPESHQEHVAEWERDERLIDEALHKLGDAKGETDGTVVPIWERTWRHARRFAPRYAVAAVAVLAVVVIWPRGGPALDPRVLAARILDHPNATRQYASAMDRPGWSVARGPAVSLTSEQTAFRLGVRLVDLAVAVGQPDSLRVGTVAANLRSLLQGVDLSEATSVVVREITDQAHGGAGLDSVAPLFAMADEQLDRMLDVESYELGLWCGAARFAAFDRNVDFFISDTSRRILANARALPADAARLMTSLASMVRSGVGEDDFGEIGRLVDAVISALGG